MLKTSANKLRSSMASFLYVNNDLPKLWPYLDWKQSTKLPSAIVRSEKDHLERLEAIRIAVLVYHIEIMKQALYEHIDFLQITCGTLNPLKNFMLDLRNAFAHTNGKLHPKWSQQLRTGSSFSIEIPIKNIGQSKMYDAKSKTPCKITWRNIKPNRRIRINGDLIDKIYLLSCHILEITKKQKASTFNTFISKLPRS